MSLLKQLAQDLPEFFGEKPAVVRAIPKAEKRINDETEAFLRDNPTVALLLCARIRYGNRCGFADTGMQAFVVNGRNDKSVRVTVRVSSTGGRFPDGQANQIYTLAAGQEVLLGCTRGLNIPVTDYSFEVIGCEIL
ncbi:MAG: hypothetical protein ABI977_12585 [Acidobacteriota bacterium]